MQISRLFTLLALCVAAPAQAVALETAPTYPSAIATAAASATSAAASRQAASTSATRAAASAAGALATRQALDADSGNEILPKDKGGAGGVNGVTQGDGAGHVSAFSMGSGVASAAANGVNAAGGVAATATWFDNAYCNTVGRIVVRASGAWICAASLPIDPVWFGADSTGVADSSAAIQSALTAAAAGVNGGAIRFPCGSYKVGTALSVTIPARGRLSIIGASETCARIWVTGAIAGLTLNYADQYSSAEIGQLQFLTDNTTNAAKAIVLSQTTANANPALSAQSNLHDLTFGPKAGNGANTQWFARAIDIENVSNVSITDVFEEGAYIAGVGNGQTIYLRGLPASSTYGVVYDIRNVRTMSVGACLYIDDWIQGVTVYALNCTQGTKGVAMTPSPSSNISQIAVINSQFGNNSDYDIDLPVAPAAIYDSRLVGVQILSSNFSLYQSTGGGVKICGLQTFIGGNVFLDGTGLNSRYMIDACGNQANISSNILLGSANAKGIRVSGRDVMVAGNLVQNLSGAAYTVAASGVDVNIDGGNANGSAPPAFSVDPAATNVVVKYSLPVLVSQLPTCQANMKGSVYSAVVNANSPAWNSAVAGAGTSVVGVRCNGANWVVQ
ncbi:glycosyl hydrolase family 28-related protein [Methylocystis sp. JAN1]|uniref:glycosyl hydrolase family 28-related protein n=1 Tax=Methylocystis sp. JAN1 TaxID=3397211 RepID=UPI003FA20DCC